MSDPTENDLEKVTLTALQAALTVLFAVLRRHNTPLADDLALEIAQVSRGAQHYFPETTATDVARQLDKWTQALRGETASEKTPHPN